MAIQEVESYSGDSSYKYVDALIKNNDKELMIVSPYISDYYTKLLIKEAQSKSIRIITSENSLSYKDSLLKNFVMKSISGYIKGLAFFLVLDLISIYLKFTYTTIILTIIFLALMLILVLIYKKYKRTYSNIKVKVAKNKFVHEKLYIGSDMAITGSANLTYNGMHKNVEHIDVIKDQNRVNELKTHFESLWSKN